MNRISEIRQQNRYNRYNRYRYKLIIFDIQSAFDLMADAL